MSVLGGEALGQLLMIGLEDDHWTSRLERLVRRFRPGGIVLSARNLCTPESTAQMLAKIARALGAAPFLVLAEEGGSVDPLRVFFPSLPSPRAAARGGHMAVRRLGDLVGSGLGLLGFNTDLAPVLDLSIGPAGPGRDTQIFSTDPQHVTRCGRAFLEALRRHKVIGCGKHFPGFGAARPVGDNRLPVVDKTMAELWRRDLVPFRELLPELALVMVSNAVYKAYDFDVQRPASLSSSVLESLLRIKMNYRGLVLANLCEARVRGGGEGWAASRSLNAFADAVKAGCDMVMVGRQARIIALTLEGLGKALDSRTLPASRVEQTLRRIRSAKRLFTPPTGKISRKVLEQLAQQFERFSKECREPEGEDRRIA
jgi:beta-N-acetylhexosaminidase